MWFLFPINSVMASCNYFISLLLCTFFLMKSPNTSVNFAYPSLRIFGWSSSILSPSSTHCGVLQGIKKLSPPLMVCSQSLYGAPAVLVTDTRSTVYVLGWEQLNNCCPACLVESCRTAANSLQFSWSDEASLCLVAQPC